MLINRIGTFFVWIGFGLIGLFVVSDIAHTPVCGFLIFGVLFVSAGVYLWMRDPFPKPQPTGRFRLFRSAKKQDKK
ncbi:MAG: hypothetical protein EHM21_04340 [Chloroflexi bacterium]|nr:MAG: hypothetical protein EHM21_04340 [Chloroflexota bacterium]